MAFLEASIQKELDRYKPALALDSIITYKERQRVKFSLIVITGILAVLAGFESVFATSVIPVPTNILIGLAIVGLGLLLIVMQFSFFYASLYYRGLANIIHNDNTGTTGITYEVAEILAEGNQDLTLNFFQSSFGQEIAIRSGITSEALQAFFQTKTTVLGTDTVRLPHGRFYTLYDLNDYIYMNDKALRTFLTHKGIQEEVYLETAAWIIRNHHNQKQERRWWSRDNLGRISSVGNNFMFGVAYDLEEYAQDLYVSGVGTSEHTHEKVIEVENVLARGMEANVLIVGEPGVGKIELIQELNNRIRYGEAVDAIENKQIILFDSARFVAGHPTKQEFEGAFLKMMNQAHNAGNIIVAIEDLSVFLSSAGALGVNVADLIDQHLSSKSLQFIATNDPHSFHQNIETNGLLLQHFEVVRMEGSGVESTARVLEDVVPLYESQYRKFFTYPALRRIAEDADRYITDGVMPDKAVSLLAEVASYSASASSMLITPEMVDEYVSTKTGIPTGPVQDEERELLLNLENVLHQRVIGQDAAITAISNALRRARTNVQTSTRPMGSFLFLGSTGVGKTETVKALADLFFGDEDEMVRLDMSEFSGENGLIRLIGTSTAPGHLASLLRDNPHGVLLLDEFEKASPDVHDLFLQILDEGIFTDARGDEINARNMIIIATSNAGSSIIWEFVRNGEDPREHRDEIINAIVTDNTFRPELMNRFDDTVIFEPLSESHRLQIAELMLKSLKERVAQMGYELTTDESITKFLATGGYNQEFGARPMRRLLQDTVEAKISDKILRESLTPGASIHFTEADLVV